MPESRTLCEPPTASRMETLMARRNDRLDTLVSLSKRRGIVYPSSEIYGGLRAAWDYGPLGVEIKNNIKRQWWRSMVQERDDVVGLDSSVILSPEVWKASGHITEFVDPLTECTSCHHRFRADHLIEGYEAKHGREPEHGLADIACPNCGTRGAFTEPRMFNGLLRTYLGAVERDGEDSESGLAYLRPETAQGIFINYRNVLQTSRRKLPFGIGQIGKSFRNEITPGNFIFRTREFEQMEMEFFVRPGTDEEWHERWIETRLGWYVDLGVTKDNLRLYEHPADKRSHYSTRTVDIEYRYDFTGTEWGELEGIANRTDYDLGVHAKASGQDMSYLDAETGERFTPYVIEPAAGVDRAMLMFLLDAFTEDEAPDAKGKLEKRTVLRLDPRLAPVKVAVLPLSRHADLSPKARDIAAQLRKHWNCEFDDASAIGRRYRRQDEIGTPYCVTIDFDTLQDQAVTVRERDSMRQDRVGIDALPGYLMERLAGC
jgi:glycyl-tRNA synthetase